MSSSNNNNNNASASANIRKLMHRNAASVLFSRGPGGGASTTTTVTQDIARRAAEEEFRQKRKRLGGTRGKGGGGDLDDYFSSDDEDEDDDDKSKKRTKEEARERRAKDKRNVDDEYDGDGVIASLSAKYRDRAKERREGKPLADDSDSTRGSDSDEGTDASDDNDRSAEASAGSNASPRREGAQRRKEASIAEQPTLLLATSKEEALLQVLPTSEPQSGLGREVLQWLRTHYCSREEASHARRYAGIVAVPTPAGRALQRSVLNFGSPWTVAPRDVARSWQVPTAAESTSSSLPDNASSSSQIACLGPDMIRKIDAALTRSFLRGQVANAKSAIMTAADAGGVGVSGPSEPSRDVGPETRHNNNINSQGDDDDDDIFGSVGEYNPDDDDDDGAEEREEHESGGGQKDGDGKATISTAAPSPAEASGPAKERRMLFGNVLESVVAAGATSAPARPSATEATPDDGNDDDGDARHKGATRLAGLSEVVDGYGDDMDADFTGMHDEDPDQKKKKTKTKSRKKKSGESDSE
jgi:hypothetical protein